MTFPDDAAVIALAKPLIQRFEGFRATPYLCPAGRWTIGWGTTRYPSGRKVSPGDYPGGILPAFALAFLLSAMMRVRNDLEACISRAATLHQAAALISLGHNVGVGAHDGIKGDLADSTLLERFNAGDIPGAAGQFALWNKARIDGVLTTLPGLAKRREAERALFLTADAP